jgi:2'-5' RNA ligase
MLRTFVALELDAEGIQQLIGVQMALHAALQSTLGNNAVGLRRTRAQQMHMTLAFLGETSEQLLQPITAVLDEVARSHTGIVMAGDRVCFLPNQARSTAIAIAFNDPLRSGDALSRQVVARLAALGFEFEPRPFLAHVTLLRSRHGLRVPPETPQLLQVDPKKIVLKMRRIAYFSSYLEPTGARYERLWSAQLDSH